MSAEKTVAVDAGDVHRTSSSSQTQPGQTHEETQPKKPWWNSIREPGSATQIVIAAALAIGIGVAVTYNVEKVPDAAIVIVGIPGRLWLRSLRAVGMCFPPQHHVFLRDDSRV